MHEGFFQDGAFGRLDRGGGGIGLPGIGRRMAVLGPRRGRLRAGSAIVDYRRVIGISRRREPAAAFGSAGWQQGAGGMRLSGP